MSACSIRKLNVESLLKKTNIVDNRNIINKQLFDNLNKATKADHVLKYGINSKELPFIVTTIKDSNPNNTIESRLNNNRYSEFYTVNDPYYIKLQQLADNKEKYALTFDETESLYKDELGQDPSLDNTKAEEDFRYLINQKPENGGITQFCNI